MSFLHSGSPSERPIDSVLLIANSSGQAAMLHFLLALRQGADTVVALAATELDGPASAKLLELVRANLKHIETLVGHPVDLPTP